MKCIKILSRVLFFILAICSLIVFGSLVYLNGSLSDSYRIAEGESLAIDSSLPISISYESVNSTGGNESYGARVKVFGFIPARSITVNVVDSYNVIPLGTPFGIKIYTDGVLVVSLGDVETENGKLQPAKEAGLREGDFIVSLNGTNVYTNEEVMEIIKNSAGERITVKIIRNKTKMTLKLTAAEDIEGVYRAGMWVKDSSAGIGTLSFYSPSLNVVCGLGHGIADSETGTLLTLNHGEFVSAKIVAIEKGKNGAPGELKGRFSSKSISGFSKNCDSGVYGVAKSDIAGNLMKIAMKQEVKNGAAHILSTVEGEEPKYYSCNIKVRGGGETQNLLVEITDKELLEKTGGIVQGMSGSPIIQNGKLVGAVTHVLVDDCKKGYGIFAENMLETARGVEQLKDAG